MASVRRNALRLLVHAGAWVPLAVMFWDGLHGHLTVNPIQELTFRTGKTALTLLVLSLACTPVSLLLGLKQLVALRRPLGLYAFMYACLHLFIFAVVDYGLQPDLIKQAIVEKRYVLVGFAAFLLLTPLAITSTKGWMRRLGKRWKRLHRAVYLAAALAVIHFYWLVKADVRTPVLYGAIVTALLVLRLPPIRRGIARLHGRGVQARPRKRPADLPQASWPD